MTIPPDMKAYNIAVILDLLGAELRKFDLPASPGDNVFALLGMARDASRSLADELDPLTLCGSAPPPGAGDAPAKPARKRRLAREGNVIPFPSH